MEYGGGAALVQNNNSSNSSAAGFGSMAESAPGEVGDLIDELLVEGCWLETTAGGGGSYNMMHPSSCDDLAQAQAQAQYYMPATSTVNYNNNTGCDDDQIIMMLQQESEESFVVGKRWWIGPRGIPGGGGPTSSVKERLVVAVGYLIKEYYYTTNKTNNNNNNVLIQVWVPPRCRSSAVLEIIPHYHRLSINQDQDQDHEAVAFPNTNTNPNNNYYYVRLLRSYPPRLHQYDAPRGSLALPLLERGTGACLGVLDILIPNNNYHPHLLPLDNALQAVDYRSCHQNFIIPPSPAVKVFEELYQAAVNEIVEVMTSVCKTQNLPLALTWAPCVQQEGKCGGGCVSTVDSAWFVGDLQMLGFQEACSECHLLRGQGIVGTALTTAKPCFAMDITAFSKAEYPLSHHAALFGLHAAVAIPFRSVYTGSAADFVLEFFLPKECRDGAEQKHLLNSLSILVQQACRTLHVATSTATDHHLLLDDEADFTLPPPTPAADNHKLQQLFAEEEEEEEAKESSSSITATSWIAHMMEAQGQQNKGKGVCVYQLEDPKEEFKVTTNWDAATSQSTHHLHFTSSDFGHIDHTSASASLGSASADGGLDQQDSYAAAAAAAFGGRRSSSATSGGGRKSGDKRRTKAEKTISLPVLRQYFAGSLKDAAKSIGVCPTTLKRICRQHGITRWPSRKIKKVGHSLKKLQLVIDSVQGAEGAIQIGSFYASFPELGSADFSSSSSPTTTARSSQPSKKAPPNSLKSAAAAASASCTSQTTAAFGAANHHLHHHHHHHHHQQANNPTAVMMTMTESCDAAAAAELQQQHASSSMLIQEGEGEGEEEEDTKKHFAWRGHGAFRVKATFVDEKIRFSLQPNWGFRDLQVEIARRFNLNDISNMDLKYLDDDGEWVLLACDADLHECKDIHTSSQTRTIRLSLFPSTCPPS